MIVIDLVRLGKLMRYMGGQLVEVRTSKSIQPFAVCLVNGGNGKGFLYLVDLNAINPMGPMEVLPPTDNYFLVFGAGLISYAPSKGFGNQPYNTFYFYKGSVANGLGMGGGFMQSYLMDWEHTLGDLRGTPYGDYIKELLMVMGMWGQLIDTLNHFNTKCGNDRITKTNLGDLSRDTYQLVSSVEKRVSDLVDQYPWEDIPT